MVYSLGYLALAGGLQAVGEFSAVMSVLSPIAMFSVFRYVESIGVSEDKADAFSTSLCASLTIYLLGAIFLFLPMVFFMDFGLEKEIIFTLIFFKALEMLNDHGNAYLTSSGQTFLATTSNIIKLFGVVALSLFFGFILEYSPVITISLSLFLSFFLAIIFFDSMLWVSKVRFGGRDGRRLSGYILENYQYGFVSLLASVNSNVPRYFLMTFSSLEVLGLFSLIYLVASASVNVLQYLVSVKIDIIRVFLLHYRAAFSLSFVVCLALFSILGLGLLCAPSVPYGSPFYYPYLAFMAFYMFFFLFVRGVLVSVWVFKSAGMELNFYFAASTLCASGITYLGLTFYPAGAFHFAVVYVAFSAILFSLTLFRGALDD